MHQHKCFNAELCMWLMAPRSHEGPTSRPLSPHARPILQSHACVHNSACRLIQENQQCSCSWRLSVKELDGSAFQELGLVLCWQVALAAGGSGRRHALTQSTVFVRACRACWPFQISLKGPCCIRFPEGYCCKCDVRSGAVVIPNGSD